MTTLAVVVACGRTEEIAAGTETAFLSLGNRPVLAHVLMTLERSETIDGIVIAVAKERVESALQIARRFGCTKLRGIVVGGASRLSTLRTVLAKLPEPAQTVAVVEASRPLLPGAVLGDLAKAAKRYGCAIAAHKVPDAVKVAPSGLKATQTLERNTIWVAQGPQMFRTEVLEEILASGSKKKIKLLDDESEFVSKSAEVHLIESGGGNMKIRTSRDLAMASAMLHAKLT